MTLNEIVNRERMFVKATGTFETVGLGSAPTEVGKGKVDEVGIYGMNNGTLAFVDADQNRWVGRPTRDAIQALQEAGYSNRGVYVPHSNDCGAGMRRLFGK